MKKIIELPICTLLAIFVVCFMYGCEGRYNFSNESEPQIVLFSLINPDSQIVVDLYWTQKYYEPMVFKRVQNAEVILYEDDAEIARMISKSSRPVVFSGIKPKHGSKYTLEVKEGDRKTLKASTIVPTKIDAVFELSDPYKTAPFKDVKISNIDCENSNFEYLSFQSYIIVDESKIPNNGHEWESLDGNDFRKHQFVLNYSESIYFDDFNKRNDYQFGWADALGTNCSYTPYARLNKKLVASALPITMHVEQMDFANSTVQLMPLNAWYYPEIYPDLSEVTISVKKSLMVRVAAMDKHYDAYRKAEIQLFSYNQSMEMRPVETILSGNEPCGLPSNVQNGLGVFGSYSVVDFIFDNKNYTY